MRQSQPFSVGDLVLFDELMPARVVETWTCNGVRLFSLRLASGFITDGVVSGYLRPLPVGIAPKFRDLLAQTPSGRAWRESSTEIARPPSEKER